MAQATSPLYRHFESLIAKTLLASMIDQRHVPFALHTSEQQSPFTEHGAPLAAQAQAGSVAQSESLQSMNVSQSLSMPSVQLDSVSGGSPQSAEQLH